MKRSIVLLVIWCSVALARATTGDSSVASFRGVPFGSSESEARRILGGAIKECQKDPLHKGERWCFGNPGESAAPFLSFSLTFMDDHFVESSATFAAAEYSRWRAIFAERYGDPKHTETSSVRNGPGATLENETTEWESNDIAVVITRYGANRTSGSIVFATHAYLAEQKRRAAEQKERDKAF